jgi:malyl-CoA/(S)-citramalyl-CoA lyase
MKPHRTTLSVPGHREKMHQKALGLGTDVIMLDLEDSVPLDEKENARRQVIKSLTSLDWGDKTVSFRMNALDTPFGFRDLLEVVEAAGEIVDTVVVPKIDSPGDVHFVSRLLDGIAMHHKSSHRVGIEASIESAQGMENINQIAGASDRIQTLTFGIADYQSSIGARLVSISGHGEKEEELYPGHRWNYAMSRIVNAAKANGVMAIDAPYGNFRDPEGLRRAAVMSCALGFDGKWVIHPDQIDTVNQVFSPAAEDIERARKVLDAARQAREKGLGAVSLEGRMVDNATVRMATILWEQARKLKLV